METPYFIIHFFKILKWKGLICLYKAEKKTHKKSKYAMEQEKEPWKKESAKILQTQNINLNIICNKNNAVGEKK